jgi:penicillin-binding protein 1C
LPPIIEWYYRKHHPNYVALPSYQSGCESTAEQHNMQFIYPRSTAKIFVPREIDGQRGKTVFELAHRKSSLKVFWHLDGEYIGYTKNIHQMPLSPEPGKHELSVVDENGEMLNMVFEIVQ